MRHEAKLRVIKHAAKVSNFKNVCKTVTKRHQHLICFYIQSNLLIRNTINTGPCEPFLISSQPESLQSLLNETFAASNATEVSFVSSNGHVYKPNTFLVLKDDALSPIFSRITLLKKKNEHFLVLHDYETLL